MYKYIESLVLEKDFTQAIDMLLINYGKVSSKERLDYDKAIIALEYFKPYQYHFPKTAEEIYFLWKDFDKFLIEKKIYKTIPIVHIIAYTLMKDIFSQYNIVSSYKESCNIRDSIMYATSMIWVGELKNASSLLLNLLKENSLEAEVWGLCGKIYDILGDKKKSQIFYREAFFINPSVLNLIDIRYHLVDDMIDFFLQNLESVASIHNKEDLLEWIGIGGILGEFFEIRQILSTNDEKLLDRRIDVYEGYYFKGKIKNKHDFVKLLRLYLFKYDHYKATQEETSVQETLKKIELLSPLIYNQL